MNSSRGCDERLRPLLGETAPASGLPGRVYWLNTMLLHLWLFGADYRSRCERLAREIATLRGHR